MTEKIEARAISSLRAENVDEQSRTIAGTILRFGVVGTPSTGPTRFEAGSLVAPAELRRVKLLVDHDHSQPVGYMTRLDITDTSAQAVFKLPPGPMGDLVLAQARDGLRDGLSVGCQINDYGWSHDGSHLIVRAAELREVSVLAVPAYADATVTTVHAAHMGDKIMPDTTDEQQQQTTDEQQQQTTRVVHREVCETRTLPADTSRVTAAHGTQVVERQAPPPAPLRASTGLDLHGVSRAIAGAVRAGLAPTPGASITAALADIIPADYPGDAAGVRPQFVGELWKASRVERPLIDLFGSPKVLDSLKVYGFRRSKGFRVAQWAGNKTEIPTGKGSAVLAEATAQRFAGGADIDRVFVDFGEASLIESILQEGMDEYRLQTEAWWSSLLAAQASSIADAGGPIANFGALSLAFAKMGASMDFIAVAPDVWTTLTSLTQAEAPWWLVQQGNRVNFRTRPGVDAADLPVTVGLDLAPGTLMAADRRAATFYEAPVQRVQALDVAHGGVDVALYGYAAGLVNDPAAIVKIGPAA